MTVLPVRELPGLAVRAALLLVGMAVLGLLALVAVDSCVPMDRVAARLAQAEAQNRLGTAMGKEIRGGVELNYFSDCMALSTAAGWDGRQPAFSVRSPAILWTPGDDLCRRAAADVAQPGRAGWFDYGRYWHGYRVVLFPLYALMPLQGVQAVMLLLLVGALTALAGAAARVAGWAAGLPLFLGLLATSGVAQAYALPTHALSLAVLFGGTAAVLALAPRGPRLLVLLAVGVGAAYNYVDFFYNPAALAVLLGGAVVLPAVSRGPGPADAVRAGLAAGAALAGYLGFWSLKWLIGLAVIGAPGGQALVQGGDFGRWLAGGPDYRVFAALGSLVRTASQQSAAIPMGLVLMALVLAGLARPAGRHAFACMAVPLLIAAAALEAAAGHTWAHRGFTYRTVPIALSMLAALGSAALAQPRKLATAS